MEAAIAEVNSVQSLHVGFNRVGQRNFLSRLVSLHRYQFVQLHHHADRGCLIVRFVAFCSYSMAFKFDRLGAFALVDHYGDMHFAVVDLFESQPIEASFQIGNLDTQFPRLPIIGTCEEMRAERDVVALISNCPQLNNPCNAYNPTPAQMLIWDA